MKFKYTSAIDERRADMRRTLARDTLDRDPALNPRVVPALLALSALGLTGSLAAYVCNRLSPAAENIL